MIKFRLRRTDTKRYAAQLNHRRTTVWQSASSPIRSRARRVSERNEISSAHSFQDLQRHKKLRSECNESAHVAGG